MSQNPEYLFSKTFNPYKVKAYGVSLGDPASSIDPSTILNQPGLPNAIYTTNHVTYTITNGKVSEITLNHNGINDNLTSQAQIIIKFGQPHRTETVASGGNPTFQTNYYYINKGLVIMYFDTASSLILVHIIGN